MYCLQHSKVGQNYVHPATRHEVTAGEYRYSFTLYLTSALDGGGGGGGIQRHAPAALLPGKRTGTHCTGGWVGPRPGLDWCGEQQ
jgi:hypothetical protein